MWRRQAVHRSLAGVVADPEERARHLALSTDRPDPAVASELDVAAEHAAARGARPPRRALRSSPQPSTPPERSRNVAAGASPPPGFTGSRATSSGRARSSSSCSARSRAASSAPMCSTRSRRRGGRTSPRASVSAARPPTEAAGDDVRLVQILGFRAISRWVNGDVPGALRDAREGLERAERVGDPRLVATAICRVGLIETWALEITPGSARARRRDRGAPRAAAPVPRQPQAHVRRPVASLQDELDRAAEMLEALERDAVARGDEHARAFAVLQMIFRDWYAGRWRSALEHAAVALELAEQTGEVQYAAMACSYTASVQADAGLVEQARATAQRGLACAERDAGRGLQCLQPRGPRCRRVRARQPRRGGPQPSRASVTAPRDGSPTARARWMSGRTRSRR